MGWTSPGCCLLLWESTADLSRLLAGLLQVTVTSYWLFQLWKCSRTEQGRPTFSIHRQQGLPPLCISGTFWKFSFTKEYFLILIISWVSALWFSIVLTRTRVQNKYTLPTFFDHWSFICMLNLIKTSAYCILLRILNQHCWNSWRCITTPKWHI